MEASFVSLALVVSLSAAQGAEARSAVETARNWVAIQEGNNLPQTGLVIKRSHALLDNRTGGDYGGWFLESGGPLAYSWRAIDPLGLKWVRIAFSDCLLNWQRVQREDATCAIERESEQREAAAELARQGISIVLNLGCGFGPGRLDKTRFQSEEEIEEYCNYARLVVRRFKDWIKYYEIWNEPNVDAPWGQIAARDYARLVRRAALAIHKECPDAKVVIGAVGGRWDHGHAGYEAFGRYTLDMDFLKEVLTSGVAPLVDMISWHPFYGHRPDDPYYRTYPDLVGEIKELAELQGFKGQYLGAEMLWRVVKASDEPQKPVSGVVSAKYLSRAILMHLGMNVTVSASGMFPGKCLEVVPRLCTVLSGARATSLPVKIETTAPSVRRYSFALPNGDRLVALWTDGVGVEHDPGVRSVVICPELDASKVVGIDVLGGFEQELRFEKSGNGIIIRNLRVKDYPLLLRITR